MEHRATILHASVNALPFEAGIIDSNGDFVCKNGAWEELAVVGDSALRTDGDNYFEACRQATAEGNDDAAEVIDGLESIFAGRSDGFAHKYAAEDPLLGEEQQCVVRAVKFTCAEGDYALIFHMDEAEPAVAEFNCPVRAEHTVELRKMLETTGGELVNQLRTQADSVPNPKVREQINDTIKQTERMVEGGQALAEGTIDDAAPVKIHDLVDRIDIPEIDNVTVKLPQESTLVANERTVEWAFERLFEHIAETGADSIVVRIEDETITISGNGRNIDRVGHDRDELNLDEDADIQAASRIFDAHGWCFNIKSGIANASFDILGVDVEQSVEG